MMMIGIGTPNNQSKIGIASSLPSPRHEPAFVPRPVAMLSALDRGQARGERPEEESGGHPKRELHRILAGAIDGVFRFGDDVIDTLLRVGLAQAGLPSDETRDIAAIGLVQAIAVGEARGPQPADFGPGCVI